MVTPFTQTAPPNCEKLQQPGTGKAMGGGPPHAVDSEVASHVMFTAQSGVAAAVPRATTTPAAFVQVSCRTSQAASLVLSHV